MYIYGYSDKGSEDGDRKEGREWRLPGFFLYADDLDLCGESGGGYECNGGMVC